MIGSNTSPPVSLHILSVELYQTPPINLFVELSLASPECSIHVTCCFALVFCQVPKNWWLLAERPAIINTWNNAFEEYDVSAFLYPGFSTTLP